jgi:hypothetical protein
MIPFHGISNSGSLLGQDLCNTSLLVRPADSSAGKLVHAVLPYPNPVRSTFVQEWFVIDDSASVNEHGADVLVYDVLGNVVRRVSAPLVTVGESGSALVLRGRVSIDMDDLSDGSYFVVLRSESESQVFPILLVRDSP